MANILLHFSNLSFFEIFILEKDRLDLLKDLKFPLNWYKDDERLDDNFASRKKKYPNYTIWKKILPWDGNKNAANSDYFLDM